MIKGGRKRTVIKTRPDPARHVFVGKHEAAEMT
jgi:hypothetical protein